jgi:hypothetical protein
MNASYGSYGRYGQLGQLGSYGAPDPCAVYGPHSRQCKAQQSSGSVASTFASLYNQGGYQGEVEEQKKKKKGEKWGQAGLAALVGGLDLGGKYFQFKGAQEETAGRMIAAQERQQTVTMVLGGLAIVVIGGGLLMVAAKALK